MCFYPLIATSGQKNLVRPFLVLLVSTNSSVHSFKLGTMHNSIFSNCCLLLLTSNGTTVFPIQACYPSTSVKYRKQW